MEVACLLSAGIIGRELHRAYTSAHLALRLTALVNMNAGEGRRQGRLLGCRPCCQRAHGAETAPRHGCVDEGEDDADDGRCYNELPENAAHRTPVAPRVVYSDAEGGEDQADHKQPEGEGPDERRNPPMGREP